MPTVSAGVLRVACTRCWLHRIGFIVAFRNNDYKAMVLYLGNATTVAFPQQIQPLECCCFGREEELRSLRQGFARDKKPSELVVQVNLYDNSKVQVQLQTREHCSCLSFQIVKGPVGMGKTELIFDYARKHRTDYENGIYYFFLQSLSTFYDSVRYNVRNADTLHHCHHVFDWSFLTCSVSR